ncbi:MAG: D-alanine--D-alanine ligase [Bdellovibrionota bacterium]
MNKKIHLGLVFGGRSAEHEVSILSARNVYEAIDRDKFDVSLFGIDKSGKIHFVNPDQLKLSVNNPKEIEAVESEGSLISFTSENSNKNTLPISDNAPSDIRKIDVVFPILHGPYGEDGAIQGFFKTLDIPYVGPDVLGSSVAMDKDVAKRLLRDAGIPIAKFKVLTPSSKSAYGDLSEELGSILFVKPANMGSSVGVSKVDSADEFNAAVDDAFKYDRKVIVEECIKGRELECSVLGNESPEASKLGEIITKGVHEFYSYDSKYVDKDGSETQVVDDLPEEKINEIREIAVKAFKTLCCEGMARVDFFLEDNGRAVINELNTIPGFTNISMYPKLWEASGLKYTDLITRLIELAIERHKRDSLFASNS